MKHLMTLLALVVAVTAGAQTYPWNPDSNNDQLIGFTDFLELLAVYGTSFTPENIICDADSSNAMIYVGEKNFVQCSNSCDSLGSIWHLPSTTEIVAQHANLIPTEGEASNVVWMSLEERRELNGNIYGQPPYAVISVNGYLSFGENSTSLPFAHPDETRQCFCAAKERPKVEYSYCDGGHPSSLTNCIDEKLAQGWYPLNGFLMNRDVQAAVSSSYCVTCYGAQTHASFWRWAE